MSRSDKTMLVLDDIEKLLANDVYIFDEESARQKQKNQCPRNELKVGWEIVPIKIDCKVNPVSNNTEIILTESNRWATLNKITITGLNKESLVIKPDNCGFRFYKQGTYNKACDYLILTKFNDDRYALFIDLKSCIYENQHEDSKLFLHSMYDDEKIVWQMIGANTILDSLISVLEKKSNTQHKSSNRKKKSQICELAKFQRRYIILYKKIDQTGEKMPIQVSSQQPNDKILDSPIYALEVSNQQSIELGYLISNTQ